jgi:hypothetical protein
MKTLKYVFLAVVLFTSLAAQAASPGCGNPVMRGPGAISYLNSKVGQPYGPPRRVAAITEILQDRVFGWFSGNVLQCHETLIFRPGLSRLVL